MRLSWSSAAILRSVYSAILPWISRSSCMASARICSSTWIIWNEVSAMRAFGLRDGGDQLPALAFDAGGVTLERIEARELHEVLLIELANALQLLGDEHRLARLRGLLRRAGP